MTGDEGTIVLWKEHRWALGRHEPDVDAARMVGPRLETLSQEECLALLSTASFGRVGINVDALPAVLPVRYVFHNGAVVFRTVAGTKLHDATVNAVVAFQADHYGDIHDPFGWSVLVRGVAQPITDPHTLAAVRLLPLGSWAFENGPDRYVKIEPAMVSGRRVVL